MLRKTLIKIAKYIPVYRELRQIRSYARNIHASLDAIRTMDAIRCYDLELASHPRYGDPLRLPRYAFQVNSQNGEDGIIHEIFRRIGNTESVFVEVGVGNGIENNTAFLLSQGWQGFWIDGDDTFLKAINGRKDLSTDFLSSRVSFVNQENITGIFEQLGIPVTFDLLSLDIDQNTYYIWEALREYAPRVVVVEYNAMIPPFIDWKVQYIADRVWDGTQNFGASLKAFENLGHKLGYSLVGCDFNGVNAFFVRNDLAAGKFAEPFTSENHFEAPRYEYIHRRGHAPALLDRQAVTEEHLANQNTVIVQTN